MHGHTFAAGHVANNILAPNRIAALGTIYQQVTMPFYAEGISGVIASEDAPHHADETFARIAVRFRYLP